MIDVPQEILELRDGRRVRLGPIAPSDSEEYCDYMRSVSEESPWAGMVPDEIRSPESQRELLENETSTLHWRLGAWDHDSGQMVGDCSMSRSDRAKFTHVARLGIGVRAEWRGVGLGRIMMQYAIGAAKDDPAVYRLELMVFAKNEIARNLYRSLGFVEEGISVGSVRQPDGSFDDDVHMAIRVAD